jgi:hypothetical protein
VCPAGSGVCMRLHVRAMLTFLSMQGQIESNYDETVDNFDSMDLKPDLLRGENIPSIPPDYGVPAPRYLWVFRTLMLFLHRDLRLWVWHPTTN